MAVHHTHHSPSCTMSIFCPHLEKTDKSRSRKLPPHLVNEMWSAMFILLLLNPHRTLTYGNCPKYDPLSVHWLWVLPYSHFHSPKSVDFCTSLFGQVQKHNFVLVYLDKLIYGTGTFATPPYKSTPLIIIICCQFSLMAHAWCFSFFIFLHNNLLLPYLCMRQL